MEISSLNICYYDSIIILLTEIMIISTEVADVNLHTHLVYTAGQQSEKSFDIVDEVFRFVI